MPLFTIPTKRRKINNSTLYRLSFQMILKADAGMDYAGFYTFMAAIARNRLSTLKQYLRERDLCDTSFIWRGKCQPVLHNEQGKIDARKDNNSFLPTIDSKEDSAGCLQMQQETHHSCCGYAQQGGCRGRQEELEGGRGQGHVAEVQLGKHTKVKSDEANDLNIFRNKQDFRRVSIEDANAQLHSGDLNTMSSEPFLNLIQLNNGQLYHKTQVDEAPAQDYLTETSPGKIQDSHEKDHDKNHLNFLQDIGTFGGLSVLPTISNVLYSSLSSVGAHLNNEQSYKQTLETSASCVQKAWSSFSSDVLPRLLAPEEEPSEPISEEEPSDQFTYEEEPEIGPVYEQEPEDGKVYEAEPDTHCVYENDQVANGDASVCRFWGGTVCRSCPWNLAAETNPNSTGTNSTEGLAQSENAMSNPQVASAYNTIAPQQASASGIIDPPVVTLPSSETSSCPILASSMASSREKLASNLISSEATSTGTPDVDSPASSRITCIDLMAAARLPTTARVATRVLSCTTYPSNKSSASKVFSSGDVTLQGFTPEVASPLSKDASMDSSPFQASSPRGLIVSQGTSDSVPTSRTSSVQTPLSLGWDNHSQTPVSLGSDNQAQTATSPESGNQAQTATSPESGNQAQTATSPESGNQAQTLTSPGSDNQAQTATSPESGNQAQTLTSLRSGNQASSANSTTDSPSSANTTPSQAESGARILNSGNENLLSEVLRRNLARKLSDGRLNFTKNNSDDSQSLSPEDDADDGASGPELNFVDAISDDPTNILTNLTSTTDGPILQNTNGGSPETERLNTILRSQFEIDTPGQNTLHNSYAAICCVCFKALSSQVPSSCGDKTKSDRDYYEPSRFFQDAADRQRSRRGQIRLSFNATFDQYNTKIMCWECYCQRFCKEQRSSPMEANEESLFQTGPKHNAIKNKHFSTPNNQKNYQDFILCLYTRSLIYSNYKTVFLEKKHAKISPSRLPDSDEDKCKSPQPEMRTTKDFSILSPLDTAENGVPQANYQSPTVLQNKVPLSSYQNSKSSMPKKSNQTLLSPRPACFTGSITSSELTKTHCEGHKSPDSIRLCQDSYPVSPPEQELSLWAKSISSGTKAKIPITDQSNLRSDRHKPQSYKAQVRTQLDTNERHNGSVFNHSLSHPEYVDSPLEYADDRYTESSKTINFSENLHKKSSVVDFNPNLKPHEVSKTIGNMHQRKDGSLNSKVVTALPVAIEASLAPPLSVGLPSTGLQISRRHSVPNYPRVSADPPSSDITAQSLPSLAPTLFSQSIVNAYLGPNKTQTNYFPEEPMRPRMVRLSGKQDGQFFFLKHKTQSRSSVHKSHKSKKTAKSRDSVSSSPAEKPQTASLFPWASIFQRKGTSSTPSESQDFSTNTDDKAYTSGISSKSSTPKGVEVSSLGKSQKFATSTREKANMPGISNEASILKKKNTSTPVEAKKISAPTGEKAYTSYIFPKMLFPKRENITTSRKPQEFSNSRDLSGSEDSSHSSGTTDSSSTSIENEEPAALRQPHPKRPTEVKWSSSVSSRRRLPQPKTVETSVDGQLVPATTVAAASPCIEPILANVPNTSLSIKTSTSIDPNVLDATNISQSASSQAPFSHDASLLPSFPSDTGFKKSKYCNTRMFIRKWKSLCCVASSSTESSVRVSPSQSRDFIPLSPTKRSTSALANLETVPVEKIPSDVKMDTDASLVSEIEVIAQDSSNPEPEKDFLPEEHVTSPVPSTSPLQNTLQQITSIFTKASPPGSKETLNDPILSSEDAGPSEPMDQNTSAGTSPAEHKHCPHWAHCGPHLAMFDLQRVAAVLRDMRLQREFPAVRDSLPMYLPQLESWIEEICQEMTGSAQSSRTSVPSFSSLSSAPECRQQ